VIAGIGIDLVDIARVERLLGAKGERALRRLFTADELSYALARPFPAQHLAARLAAKEAAFKALAGNALARSIGWREIEVVRGEGHPVLALHGRAAERAVELGITAVWVTLTHSTTTAGAVVVLEAVNPQVSGELDRAAQALTPDTRGQAPAAKAASPDRAQGGD
jgi:holo-[acyl-carrier protein] synthase